MKGTITKEHTVWCAECIEWLQLPVETKKEAEQEFKAHYWKKINGKWLCPNCANGLDEWGRPKQEGRQS